VDNEDNEASSPSDAATLRLPTLTSLYHDDEMDDCFIVLIVVLVILAAAVIAVRWLVPTNFSRRLWRSRRAD
jgi:hypothetical protein